MNTQDEPLREWRLHRDEYLAEFLRLEGRGDYTEDYCTSCPVGSQAATPKYRCRDCFSMRLVCTDCCRDAHKENPLHVIEVRVFLFFLLMFTD